MLGILLVAACSNTARDRPRLKICKLSSTCATPGLNWDF